MTWHQQKATDLAHQTFWGAPVTIAYSSRGVQVWLKGNVHYPPDFDAHNAHSFSGDELGENSSGVVTAKRRYPAVLMLHGLGGDRNEHNNLFVRTAAALALSGFIALRIDVRGAGETGGDTRHLSVESEIEDAAQALEHLQHLEFVDQKRIAILGLSFGGLVGSVLAGRRHDEIAANVIWEGPYDMMATTRRLQGPAKVDEARKTGVLQAGLLTLSECFFDSLEALDVNATIRNFSRPVLIVQGGRDTVVLPEDAFTWQKNFVSTAAKLHMIPDADHAFTQEIWAWEAIETSVAWLNKEL